MNIFFMEKKAKRWFVLIVSMTMALCVLGIAQGALERMTSSEITLDNQLNISLPSSLIISNVYADYDNQAQLFVAEAFSGEEILPTFAQKEYNSYKGGFSFKYPSYFTITEKSFEGNEILYHIDLQGKDKQIHGYVQVWKLSEPIKVFLDKSKKAASANISNFIETETDTNMNKGYEWNYIVNLDSGEKIKARQIFIQKDDYMYVVSLFATKNLWNSEIDDYLKSITDSLKLSR